MSSQLSQEIIDRWSRGLSPVTVSGLTPSAQAYALSRLISQIQKPHVVICPTEDDAQRLYEDTLAFLTLYQEQNFLSSIDLFPGWEHSPYDPFNPSIKNRLRRIRTLFRLQHNELRLVITYIESACQRLVASSHLLDLAFTLKPSDILSREKLITKLHMAGYIQNDPVEDPGSYAIRGYLVDIFSPWSKKPYRIEFFGDEVESIKTFEPTSQRNNSEPVGSALILPIHEWSYTPFTIEFAKSNIKKYADEQEIPKKNRDALFEKFEGSVRELTFEYLWPFFEESSATLMDYAPNCKIILSDSLGLDSKYDAFLSKTQQEYETALQKGSIVTPWEKLFLTPPEYQQFKKNSILSMDGIAIGVHDTSQIRTDQESNAPLSPHIHIQLSTNEDLKNKDTATVKHGLDAFISKNEVWAKNNFARAIICSSFGQAERLSFLLHQKNISCHLQETFVPIDTTQIQLTVGKISRGFRLPLDSIAIVSDEEIFGQKKLRHDKTIAHIPRENLGSFISTLEDLSPGDYVVHTRHGIGKYIGLTKLQLDGVPQDFLQLEYLNSDKLYLPIYRLDLVQKYLGTTETLSLDKLGGHGFEKTKAKVKQAIQELAHDLLNLYAQRASHSGFTYSPPDETFREFEAKFPYAETPDQLKSIDDILHDMQDGKIMDRLICGDVGYGKTEVAMRAACKAVLDGKQVTILVPTTVLALQHERSFVERFKDYPIKIISISRFKSAKEIKESLAGIQAGTFDIVIGTHRLLSKDVHFKDLGLIIIDEEHRFGVEHKERLKKLRINTDVLTLTATPIPRTLHLSLLGIRDISVINTPPVDRLSVRTYVVPFEESVIQRAIRQELTRGGQVYFIHNRVQSIHAMADKIHSIVPEAKILVAHGQLEAGELEKRMLDFYNKKYDVLLCSTIIESGVDISSANTMLINRADMFGLSQLYQLRGRVGRSQVRAYCYLLLPEGGSITNEAKLRLEALQRFADLGSGFKIASHDLEMRGGGDILGKAQSGHIAAVGFELYTELLDEAIRELKGEITEEKFDPEIKVPVPVLLPETYVPDIQQRLSFYKKLSQAKTTDELHELELSLKDRYGNPPEEVQNLFWLIKIKQLLSEHRIKILIAGKERTSLDVGDQARLSPAKTMQCIQKKSHLYSLTPDSKILIKKPFTNLQNLHQEVYQLLSLVAEPKT